MSRRGGRRRKTRGGRTVEERECEVVVQRGVEMHSRLHKNYAHTYVHQ